MRLQRAGQRWWPEPETRAEGAVWPSSDIPWLWAMVAQAACCAEIPPFQEGHPYCPWCGSRREMQ